MLLLTASNVGGFYFVDGRLVMHNRADPSPHDIPCEWMGRRTCVNQGIQLWVLRSTAAEGRNISNESLEARKVGPVSEFGLPHPRFLQLAGV